MEDEISATAIRNKLLEVIKDFRDKSQEHNIQSQVIVVEAAKSLGIKKDSKEDRVLLTVFNDLLRMGILGWGYNIDNVKPPFLHITENGRKSLENLEHDPVNPDGYLSHLSKQTKLDDVTLSYLEEALKTYNSGCIKATAVMIGAASERLSLGLRDHLVKKMSGLGKTPSKDLEDWRIKRILTALKSEFDSQKKSIPVKLFDAYDGYWFALVHQVRSIRNDAGHPTVPDPVNEEIVHSALLLFPTIAKLAQDLKKWISSHYK